MKKTIALLITAFLVINLILTASVSARERQGARERQDAGETQGRKKKNPNRIPAATCKEFPGSIFKPCICSNKVPKGIKFRPSLKECGGDAAAILSGAYVSSYSVVLRDSQNRDRFPPQGYNGCTPAEVEKGLSKCSAFKCQKVIRTKSSSVLKGAQQICCFGEPGTSSILQGATRMTIKLQDIPNSSADPLVRVCLKDFDPDKPLN